MLFLSWGGRPIFNYLRNDKPRYLKLAVDAVTALHKLQVLHQDAEPRNMVYDERSGRLMLVDLERAEVRTRQALGVISVNRKRKRVGQGKDGTKPNDGFTHERRAVEFHISKFL